MKLKIVALVLLFVATSAPAQEGVQLSLDDARNLATQSLLNGDPRLAVQIAETLLNRDPDDRRALIIVAAGAPRLGDAARGREAGARAWRVSTTDEEKYEAARLTALAAANNEQLTLATFWLRRALTVTPNEEERQRTLRDARAVRLRNPLAIELSGSLVPSNNVNGGADEQTDEAGQFSEDALALEGWRASLNFGLRYRLQEDQRSRTTAGLSYQLNRVWVTDDIEIPDDAFNTTFSEVSLTHDRALTNGTLSMRIARGLFEFRDLDLNQQRTTYDKYDLWRFLVNRNVPLNDRYGLSVTATHDRFDYKNERIGEVLRSRISPALNYRFENDDRVSLSLAFADSESGNPSYVSDSRSINLSYQWAEPVSETWFDAEFPVTLSAGVGYQWTDYPEYPSFVGIGLPFEIGRDDETVTTFANIGLPSLEYAGFSPNLRVDASRTASTLDRFDRTTVTMALTFNSSF